MEKRTAARQIWLLYFNRVLQENHLISPAEARRMQRLILHAQESPSGPPCGAKQNEEGKSEKRKGENQRRPDTFRRAMARARAALER